MQGSDDIVKVFHYGYRKKQPLILIHGFPYDHVMWKNQIQYLQADHHIVAFDIRGLGESRTGEYRITMEDLVDDLFEIIEKYDLKDSLLFGLSMGGYISFRAIERDQSKFRALVIMDSKTEADSNNAKLKRAHGIKTIRDEGLDKYLDASMPLAWAKSTIENSPKLFQKFLHRAKTFDPAGVSAALFAMLSRTNTTRTLSNIKIPTLFLVGESDNLTTPESVKKIYEKVENSTFEIVPNAGHMSPIENPDFVNKQIGKFLRSIHQ